jgi:hypothetical protein
MSAAAAERHPAPAGFGFTDPFPHFLAPDFLDPKAALALARELDRGGAWRMQRESFYDHWACELHHSEKKDAAPELVAELLDRSRAAAILHFDARLAPVAQAMAHRMGPGNRIGVHNDAPALGFEGYRILVYLEPPPSGQGQLFLHAPPPEERSLSIAPEPGLAVGMALDRRSLHSVGPVLSGQRSALVLNHWHAGNSPAIERAVLAFIERLAASEDPLRARLNLLLAACRAVPDAKQALAANLAARSLSVFGAPDETCLALFLALIPSHCWGSGAVLAGPAVAARAETLARGLAGEEGCFDAASLVAAALGRLPHGTFDAALWEAQRARLGRLAPPEQGSPAALWQALLFP